MESLFKTVVFFVGVCAVVVGGAFVIGTMVAPGTPNVKEIAETPCIPVLSNGEGNPHYRNMWYQCKRSCIGAGRYASLDIKTCKCSCD